MDEAERQQLARERLERTLRFQEAKPLAHGDHLLFHYAIRCLCKECGRLMDWETEDGEHILQSECCGYRYRLMPRTVVVEVTDVSSRPILPKMQGSCFSDPRIELKKLVQGPKNGIPTQKHKGFSSAQRNLRMGVHPSGHGPTKPSP